MKIEISKINQCFSYIKGSDGRFLKREKLKCGCGIYWIRNKINGKFYIGSSKNIRRRWIRHVSNLNKNIHENEHLQRAWNKYGKEAFKFEVLEETTAEKRIAIEQWYLDNTSCCSNGYNLRKDVEEVRIWTDEDRKLASDRLKNEYSTGFRKKRKPVELIESAESRRKPFLAFKNGMFAGEFSHRQECADKLGLNSASIYKVLIKERTSLFSYTFEYKQH